MMNYKLKIALIIVFLFFNNYAFSQEKNEKGFSNVNTFKEPLPDNLISNKEMAIKIGEIILKSYYGEMILKELPLTAELYNNEIWIIRGTLQIKNERAKGGTAHLEIRKSDCKILNIYHGK